MKRYLTVSDLSQLVGLVKFRDEEGFSLEEVADRLETNAGREVARQLYTRKFKGDDLRLVRLVALQAQQPVIPRLQHRAVRVRLTKSRKLPWAVGSPEPRSGATT